MGWVHLGFNIGVGATCAYVVWVFYTTIQSDVNAKVAMLSLRIVEEITRCQQDYTANMCDPSTRVPGMVAQCRQWEECLSRDPLKVARAKFSAQTLGEVLNEFFDTLSWKTITCLLVLFGGTLLAYNGAFYLARHAQQEVSRAVLVDASSPRYALDDRSPGRAGGGGGRAPSPGLERYDRHFSRG
jgi:hypothetical protein